MTSAKTFDAARDSIETLGYRTFSFADAFADIKKGFLIFDAVLGVVGFIALVVASLGIVNTMVMSILERYHEIGVMKAVGASNLDIKTIFFCESGAIGFLGGVAGLALGWSVSGLINRVVNYFLTKQGVPHMNYFNFPWWLLAGAVMFAVFVSLASGVYPAIRAARIDPVRALRHE
jgi:putative ABC transport system permease protein